MLVLSSHSRAARSRAAERDILRRRASRSSPVLMSGDTRQLYTSVFMHYIVVHQGHDCPANHFLSLTFRLGRSPELLGTPSIGQALRWLSAIRLKLASGPVTPGNSSRMKT